MAYNLSVRKKTLALLLSAATIMAAPAIADVKAGVDAWERGDYDAAVAEWRQPALDGNADAQFNLGQAYKFGRGVGTDLKLAADWFKRAADQGHLQAIDNYGLILFQDNQRKAAMPYIRSSAARGEPRAQYILGTAHFNGDLAEKDWVRAYALMTRASASGLSQASKNLAAMDQHIPLNQRQEGLALANRLEVEAASERRRQLGGFAQANTQTQQSVPVQQSTQSAIQQTTLPPSNAAPIGQGSTSSADPRTAGADFARPPAQPVAPPPAAAPVRTAVPQAAIAQSQGKWRLQLGAFGSRSKAQSLWSNLQSRNSSLRNLQPFYEQAGAITRLKAGPFATRNQAVSVCTTLKAAGQDCFPTSK